MDSNQIISLFSLNKDSSGELLDLICANTQKNGSEKAFISGINNLLINAKTRSLGLEVLQNFILYCPENLILEYLLEWISFCMVHHSEDSEKEIKLITLTKILENVNLDSISKKFTSEYLNIILKACMSHQNNEEQIINLKCLNQCMKRFPNWFGNHKAKLELYLLSCLDNSCEIVVNNAAICYLNFLQTGPAGVNGVNYINNFATNIKKICATLQILFNNLLAGDNDVMEVEDEILKFVEVTPDFLSRNITDITATRILNCLIFLKIMLLKKFSVEKRIIPNEIISVISRGLSKHICFLDISGRNYILRKIYLYLLGFLKSFIQGYHTFLMPFSVLIETIILDSISRIYRCNCFVLDINYKTLVYKLLLKWLSVTKPINDLQFQNKIMPYLLQDISLTKKRVELNLNKKTDVMVDTTNRLTAFTEKLTKNNCVYALETLQLLLTSSFSFDQNFLKEIVILVINTLGRINSGQIVPPYTSILCQVKLYEVLISLLSLDCRVLLPSLQTIINLLNFGSNHTNEKITRIANKGLDLIEKISHPVCATLHICELKVSELEVSDNSKNVEFNEEEKQSGKEIKIIENILISAPDVAQDKQVEIEEQMDLAEVDEKMEDVMEFKDDEGSREILEEKSAENVVKMVNNLDDMFGSFKDVVQD